MTARTQRIATLIVLVLALMINPVPAAESQQQKAGQILNDTGVKGGLIVHIGSPARCSPTTATSSTAWTKTQGTFKRRASISAR